jgi:hypothetical protein
MMGDKVYCNAFFKVAPRVDQTRPTLNLDFDVKLAAPIVAAPWVVINHNNNQKEIFVQARCNWKKNGSSNNKKSRRA